MLTNYTHHSVFDMSKQLKNNESGSSGSQYLLFRLLIIIINQ